MIKTNSSPNVVNAIAKGDSVNFAAYASKPPENPANPEILAKMVSGLSEIANVMLEFLKTAGEEKTANASDGIIYIPDAIGGLAVNLKINYSGEIVGEPSMENPAKILYPKPIKFWVNDAPFVFYPQGFAGEADVAAGAETVKKSVYVCTGDEGNWVISGTGDNRYLRNDLAMFSIFGNVVNYSSESNYIPNFPSQMTTSNTGYGISNQSKGVRARNYYIVNTLRSSDAQKFIKDLYESGAPLIIVVDMASGVNRACTKINILLKNGINTIRFEDNTITASCTYRGAPATAGRNSIRPGSASLDVTPVATPDVMPSENGENI